MYFPGHIALSYLSSRYLNAELKTALAAGIFPDVFDKFSYYVLGLTPGARVPAHTVAAMIITSIIAGTIGIRSRRHLYFAGSWALAYGLHLISDLLNGPVYFFWPFISTDYTGYESIGTNWARADIFEVVLTIVVEIALTMWAVRIWIRSRTGCRERPAKVDVL